MNDIKLLKVLFFLVPITLVAVSLWPLSRDYENYLSLFESLGNFADVFDQYYQNDLIIPLIFYCIQNSTLSFVLIISLALFMKIYFFRSISDFYWIALLLYLARFFLLHDVTQIKVSLASGLLALAYISIYRQGYFGGLIFLVTGVFTHISILLYVPIILLSATVSNPRLIMRWLITLSFAILTINQVIDLGAFLEYIIKSTSALDNLRILNYLEDVGSLDSPVGVYMFIKVFFILYAAFLFKNISISPNANQQTYRVGIIVIFSLLIFFLFRNFSYPIAARFSEIVAPFEAVFLANSFYMISKEISAFDRSAMLSRIIFISLSSFVATLVFIPQLNLLQ